MFTILLGDEDASSIVNSISLAVVSSASLSFMSSLLTALCMCLRVLLVAQWKDAKNLIGAVLYFGFPPENQLELR